MVLIICSSHPEADAKATQGAGLAGAVEAALSYAKDLDGAKIYVTVMGAYVVLDGTVPEQRDADQAIKTVEAIVGKPHVLNRLIVRYSGDTPGEGWHRH